MTGASFGLRTLLLIGLSCGAFCANRAAAAPSKVYDDVIRQTDVMVAARDAVLLATDIYRPGTGSMVAPERLPVLLHRTPYDKSEAATVAIAETLAKHGYVVLVQDTRGRHHSQGVFEKYYSYDAYDGYDTIEWAARQAILRRQGGHVRNILCGAHTGGRRQARAAAFARIAS